MHPLSKRLHIPEGFQPVSLERDLNNCPIMRIILILLNGVYKQ
jgi:hypothetical protein